MRKIFILFMLFGIAYAKPDVTVITKTDTMNVSLERIDYDYDVLFYENNGTSAFLPLRDVVEVRSAGDELLFSNQDKNSNPLGDHYRKEMLMEKNLKADTEMKRWFRIGIQYALALNTLALILIAIA